MGLGAQNLGGRAHAYCKARVNSLVKPYMQQVHSQAPLTSTDLPAIVRVDLVRFKIASAEDFVVEKLIRRNVNLLEKCMCSKIYYIYKKVRKPISGTNSISTGTEIVPAGPLGTRKIFFSSKMVNFLTPTHPKK